MFLLPWKKCCSRRKREDIVRRGCIDMPNLGDNEPQHYCVRRNLDYPPSAYNLRPFQGHTQSLRPLRDHTHVRQDQGRVIGPPPAYSSLRGNTNSHRPLSARVNGHRSDMNGDSQRSLTFSPPPPYSSISEFSSSRNISQ